MWMLFNIITGLFFLKKNLKKFKRKIISSDKEMTGDGTWMMSHNV